MAVVTVHSFTPVHFGEPRAVELGILDDEDSRLADRMLVRAGALPHRRVARNEPYGPDDGVMHSLKLHALSRGLANVMIDVRNGPVARAGPDCGYRARNPDPPGTRPGGDQEKGGRVVVSDLSLESLQRQVERGEIDTILACLVDMQGRLMGKRFHAKHFVASAWEETHCCNYLLATDLEMATPDGYAATGWEKGYGDYVMKPDLSTLRPVAMARGNGDGACVMSVTITPTRKYRTRRVRC